MAKIKTSFSLDQKTLEDIQNESDRLDMSRSEFIQALIADYIAKRIDGEEPALTYDMQLIQNAALYKKGKISYSDIADNNWMVIDNYEI